MTKKQITILVLILGIGIFFRYYLIKQMPGGLFPDEAANGLDINNIFKGHFSPFFARGNGREAFFFYLLALSVKLFGRGYWQHHIVSAAIGVISIFTTYLLASKLYGKTTGLLSAFFVAVSTWAIVLSRTAFRATLIPMFTSLAFYFFIEMFEKRGRAQYVYAVLAGATLAGGLYTYIAYRIMGLIFAFLLVVVLIADRKQKFKWVKTYWKAFTVSVVSGIVVFAPLAYYFLRHPGAFVGRSSQVSIFNTDLNHGHLLSTLLDVVRKSLEAFFIHGDLNWRQNISGQAFLSPLISPFFGVGLIVLTALAIRFIWQSFKGTQKINDLKHLAIISLFWGMLIPVATTDEGIPHGLRGIGMLVPAFIIAAYALMYVVRQIMKVWHHQWMEWLYYMVAVLFCGTLIFTAYTQYFVEAYNTPDNFFAFRSDLSVVSDYINQHPDKAHDYLVLDQFSLQTVDYFTTTTGNPYHVVDPANSPKLHLKTGDNLIFTQSTQVDLMNFLGTHPNAAVLNDTLNKFGQAVMTIVQMQSNDSSQSFSQNTDGSFNAINFGDRIDFAWQNQSFDDWNIKIWQCFDPECSVTSMVKDNQQNDYLSNYDYIMTDGTSSDMYFKAIGYDQVGNTLKDFGTIKLDQYR